MSESQSVSTTDNRRGGKKPPLSHGWKVVPSKTFPDRVYFYNTITKCSTWENPCEGYIESPETSLENATKNNNNKRKYDDSFEPVNKRVRPVVPKSAFAGDDDDLDDSMLVDEIEDYDEDHNDYFDNVPMNNYSLRSEGRSPRSLKSTSNMFSPIYNKPDPPVSKVISNEKSKELWTHFLNSSSDKPKAKKSLVLSSLETSNKEIANELSANVVSSPRKKIIRSRVLDSIKEKAQKSSQKKDCRNIPKSSYNPKFKFRDEKSSISSRLKRIPKMTKNLGSDACDTTNSSPLSDIYSNEKKTPAQSRLARVREKNVETVVNLRFEKSTPTKKTTVKAFEKNESPKQAVGKSLKQNSAPKAFTLEQSTDKQEGSLAKRFQLLREKTLKDAKEYFTSESILSDDNILPSPPSGRKKKVLFVGEETNEFIQSEPINVTQYVDEFIEEEMEWEPSDEQEMIKHINAIRKSLSKETELSNLIRVSDKNMERNESSEILSWVIVVDTNILLSSLSFIKDLRDTKINSYPVIYIPWRVLQELDHLKDSPKLQVGARRAIDYINDNFIAGHPRFRGQSFQDFNSMSKSESEAPDDDILQSCLNLQKKEVDKQLILLTNDKNFESKAILCGIKAYSKERFQKEVNLSNQREYNTTHNNHVNNSSVIEESDNKLCELKATLKTLLVYVVETELKLAYGDVWKQMVERWSNTQDWTLSGLIECFIKYWKAVFNYVFPKDVLIEMENLMRAFKRNVIARNDEVTDIIKVSQQLLAHMKRCRELRPYMETLDTSLKDISSLFNTTPEPSVIQYVPSSPSVDGADPSNEIVPEIKQEPEDFDYFGSAPSLCDTQIHLDKIRYIFKEIWNYIKNFVYTIEQIMSPDCANPEVNQSNLENIKTQLPQISSNLQDLIAAVEKVTLLNETEIDSTNPNIIDLSKLLINLAMRMNVSFLELMPVDSLPLSVAIFCSEVTERQLLHKSLNDFKQFHSELISGFEYIQTVA